MQQVNGGNRVGNQSLANGILTHLNLMYIAAYVLIILCAGFLLLEQLLSAKWLAPCTVPRWVKQRYRRTAKVIVASFLLCVGAVGLVDQIQGGPMGRNSIVGGRYGWTGSVGKEAAVAPGPMFNSTSIPEQILSIEPSNTPVGVQTVAGIAINPTDNAFVLVAPYGKARMDFARLPVTIPGYTLMKDAGKRTSFVPVLKVIGERSGTYIVGGFVVTYRWGPIVYRTRLDSNPLGMFTLTEK